MNGLIGDFLTPPLSPGELVAGFALGALTRGIVVGTVAALAIFPFAQISFAHVWAIVYFATGAALIMGLLGAMTAIWSEKFDHIAAVTNFIVMPMTFLSGTFYLVSRLPEPFRTISAIQPVLLPGSPAFAMASRPQGWLAEVGGRALTAALVAFLCGGGCSPPATS